MGDVGTVEVRREVHAEHLEVVQADAGEERDFLAVLEGDDELVAFAGDLEVLRPDAVDVVDRRPVLADLLEAVVLGIEEPDQIEVLDGVDEGERVVTTGAAAARP